MDCENKRYVVVISDEATQMLVSHARFLAQVSESAAMCLIEAFQEKVKSLEQFPERNPWLTNPLIPAGKYRKLLLEKRYLLVYQCYAQATEIIGAEPYERIEERTWLSTPRARHQDIPNVIPSWVLFSWKQHEKWATGGK
jgi:hypothetical protein